MDTSILASIHTDIILDIMKAAPDFSALSTLTRSCIKLYDLSKRYQFGICESVAKNQFGTFWNEALDLLLYQGKLKCQSEKQQCESLNPGIEWDMNKHFGAQDCKDNDKSVGLGILRGGSRIGIEESVELMKYARKLKSWSEEIFDDNGTQLITPNELLNSGRAFFRYWLLLLACSNNWDARHTAVEVHRAQGTLVDYYMEQAGRSVDRKAADERLEHLIAEPFLQHPLCELENMLNISNAGAGWSQLPGSMEQDGGHYWEKWNKSANMLTQLQAERYLENVILNTRIALVETIR